MFKGFTYMDIYLVVSFQEPAIKFKITGDLC